MLIRPLKQEDFDRVLDMMRVFYASEALLVHPDEVVLRKTLTDAISGSPYLEAFGFEEDGILTGYGMVAMSYSTEAGGLCAWIEDIYIEPAYRGMGFGSRFLDFVWQRYRDRVVRIRLEAEPENERAMAVYRKAGFEILGYTQLVRELG
jgi:ribosomal protein S18 acetylase RimI-like enzyme